ncbi:MAG TPA: hypothetical protein GX399_09445 [Xanthomonadaceae bacterium]|nr:hypothetical protein [Xanthomonadaceae bacterium]
MNSLAQLPGEDGVAVTTPPWFPNSEEVELLGRVGLFSPDDARALRKIWRALKGQTDDYLEMVLGMVAAHPTLATALTVPRGDSPDESMGGSATTRHLFRRWLFETCLFPLEPPWLRQLYAELPPGRSVQSFLALLPGFRYLIALSFPLVTTARSLLVANGFAPQDIERMQSALLKAILLQVTLLSKLYVRDELW